MPATPAERIVVIDDEERMCQSLQALLQGNGYDVATFQKSPDAIEAIRLKKIDLVITDIKMPQMTGIEILKEVKKIDEGIPVILMTGYASIDTALEAIAQGKDLDEADIYVCPVCGHTVEGSAPDKCPVCGATKDMFMKIL